MPQIPEYTAKPPGITAPETGVEAFAMAGRRIGAFYHQEGGELAGALSGAAREAQDFLDHQEISHGAVAYAGLMGDLTDEWNKTVASADPNDPTVAGKFRAQMEDRLTSSPIASTHGAARNGPRRASMRCATTSGRRRPPTCRRWRASPRRQM